MEILNKNEIERLAEIILEGGIVAIPTDTIYGFSCLATNNDAVSTLCKLKNRDDGKQFIILVSKNFDLHQLLEMSTEIQDFIDRHTPNNLTMIVNKNTDLQLANVFSLPTLAIRIPDNEFLQKLLDKVGFIVSTSCNMQGEPYINDYHSIISQFPSIDAIVEDVLVDASPSTIVDLTDAEFKVVRQGDYGFDK